MATSHKDLILDKSEVRILRSLYKGNKLLRQDVDYKFKEKYSFLTTYHLVDYCSSNPKYYCISQKGKMYLLYRKNEKIRFWVPIIISVIALILSVISILTPPVIIIER